MAEITLDDDQQMNISTTLDKCLTEEEKQNLAEQNKRLVSDYKANQLESNAQKHWDIFYKRNETRFFKDRHWTKREFEELLVENYSNNIINGLNNLELEPLKRKLLEVGCGVGNFVYPLIEDDLKENYIKYYYYACDFSPRAVDFVRANSLYNEEYIKAFQCDITKSNQLFENIELNSLDIITMIFVLSAIHPEKFGSVLQNLWHSLKPGGVVLFRDYGLYDMAQLRFKPGHKISENWYMRQDGTRSYYFAAGELKQLFEECGFETVTNCYVLRRTRNVKEGIDVPRIFLQGKFRKVVK